MFFRSNIGVSCFAPTTKHTMPLTVFGDKFHEIGEKFLRPNSILLHRTDDVSARSVICPLSSVKLKKVTSNAHKNQTLQFRFRFSSYLNVNGQSTLARSRAW